MKYEKPDSFALAGLSAETRRSVEKAVSGCSVTVQNAYSLQSLPSGQSAELAESYANLPLHSLERLDHVTVSRATYGTASPSTLAHEYCVSMLTVS